MTDGAILDARQRLIFVSEGFALDAIYGREWCADAAVQMRKDLRTVLAALPAPQPTEPVIPQADYGSLSEPGERAGDLAAEFGRLLEGARGCEFDLVPADGPIARLTLFVHEHGDRILAALTPAADAGEERSGDIAIGEFIARWDEAADGVCMDADDAQGLAREFKRMRGLIYVPGIWRCAKCSFTLMQSNLNSADGTVTARDEPGDKCPNDGSPLWRVSYRDWAIENEKSWEDLLARKDEEIAALNPERRS